MGQNINIIIIKLNNKKSNCTNHLTQITLHKNNI